MAAPAGASLAANPSGDEIPPSLAAVWRSIATEFLPMIEATLDAVKQRVRARPDDKVLPRGLVTIAFPMGQGQFSRTATPFALWKIQRLNDVYRAMTANEQRAVRRWLERFKCP